MRRVREVLRLRTAVVGLNEIARRLGVAPSTVRLTLKRLASATLDIASEGGPQSFELRAGMVAVIPQGVWHRFRSSEGATAVRELKADGLLPADAKLRSSQYLNNLIEEDHRGVKQRIAVMLGFKGLRTAAITIAGIELLQRIRKGQFGLRRLGVQGSNCTRSLERGASGLNPARRSNDCLLVLVICTRAAT